MSKEELAKQIMAEYAKDGEPITMEDALEVAEMEIKAGKISTYTTTEKSKKERKPPKKDAEKIEIIKKIHEFLLTSGEESATIVNEQKEITFREFSITLTKHRPKKGE